MQETQKQTITRSMQQRKEECLSRISDMQEAIDMFINDYCIIKKLRPVHARGYITIIKDCITSLEFYEGQLRSIDETPDWPF